MHTPRHQTCAATTPNWPTHSTKARLALRHKCAPTSYRRPTAHTIRTYSSASHSLEPKTGIHLGTKIAKGHLHSDLYLFLWKRLWDDELHVLIVHAAGPVWCQCTPAPHAYTQAPMPWTNQPEANAVRAWRLGACMRECVVCLCSNKFFETLYQLPQQQVLLHHRKDIYKVTVRNSREPRLGVVLKRHFYSCQVRFDKKCLWNKC